MIGLRSFLCLGSLSQACDARLFCAIIKNALCILNLCVKCAVKCIRDLSLLKKKRTHYDV